MPVAKKAKKKAAKKKATVPISRIRLLQAEFQTLAMEIVEEAAPAQVRIELGHMADSFDAARIVGVRKGRGARRIR